MNVVAREGSHYVRKTVQYPLSMQICIHTKGKANQWRASKLHLLRFISSCHFSCANTCGGATAFEHACKTVSITPFHHVITTIFFIESKMGSISTDGNVICVLGFHGKISEKCCIFYSTKRWKKSSSLKQTFIFAVEWC